MFFLLGNLFRFDFLKKYIGTKAKVKIFSGLRFGIESN